MDILQYTVYMYLVFTASTNFGLKSSPSIGTITELLKTHDTTATRSVHGIVRLTDCIMRDAAAYTGLIGSYRLGLPFPGHNGGPLKTMGGPN